MGAEIANVSGRVLTLAVSGLLTQPELKSMQIAAAAIFGENGQCGERKWEDLGLLFMAKGLRTFPIQYFGPAQLAAARAWLVANQSIDPKEAGAQWRRNRDW